MCFAAVGGSGFRVARSFRFASFSRHTPPTFLQALETYGFLIRAGKTSYTAGTLCEIKTQIFEKMACAAVHGDAKWLTTFL
jgi:hypothetical protein